MSDRRSFLALDWLTEEIVETLTQAVETLDAFAQNPEDITKLRFCLTYVHQVGGSLTMLEMHGAALLSKEIEALVNKAIEQVHSVDDKIEISRILRGALHDLSSYVEKVGETHEDTPEELLSALNSIREANEEEAYSESDVFNPHVEVAEEPKAQKANIGEDEFNDLIRKLRQTYQTCLVGIFRDQNLEENFALLSKVCSTLLKVSHLTASEPVWEIASAIAEYLVVNAQAATMEEKKALKQVDNIIKHMEEVGVSAFSEQPDKALIKSLLYSVATAGNVTDAIKKLKKTYQLEEALESASGAETQQLPVKIFFNFISALQKDLEKAKASLKQGEFNKAKDYFYRLRDSLSLLMVGDESGAVSDLQVKISVQLEAYEQDGEIDPIDSLLKETSRVLESLTQTGDEKPAYSEEKFTQEYSAYLESGRESLEEIKEQIVEYVTSSLDISTLEALPELLEKQISALSVSPLSELLPILHVAKRYIVEVLLDSSYQPQQKSLEIFADALSSVDYFLECALLEKEDKLAKIVEVAKESLGKLGYQVEAEEEQISSQVAVEEVVADDIPTLDVPVVTPVDSTEPVVEEVEPVLVVEESTAEQITAEPAAIAEIEEEFFQLDTEEVDEEILEIFVEEGAEVLETMEEYLPKLEANFDDEEPLLEVRRCWHTLKGSGRMVGATHMGDFAWAIEQMLNRVRDGAGKVTDNAIAIIHEAKGKVPAILKALETNEPFGTNTLKETIAKADAEREGKVLTSEEFWASLGGEPVTEVQAPVAEEPAEISAAEVAEEVEEVDDELLEIFIAEAEVHIAALVDFLDDLDPGYEDVTVTNELQRALHTLKGSAHMANVASIANLSTPLEGFVKDLANFQTAVDAEILAILIQSCDMLQAHLANARDRKLADTEASEKLCEEIRKIHFARIENLEASADSSKEISSDKYNMLLSEALDCLTEGANLIANWQGEGIEKPEQENLAAYMSRLSKTAADANFAEISSLAGALSNYYTEAIAGEALPENFFDLANQAHDELDDMMDVLAAHQDITPATDLIKALGGEEAVASQAIAPLQAEAISADSLRTFAEQMEAADDELLDIFIEEAGELLEVLEVLVEDWLEDQSDLEAVGEIKRMLHTIKGGARLAELSVLGDITHDYESAIEAAEMDDAYTDAFFADVARYQSQIAKLIDFATSGGTLASLEAEAESVVEEVSEVSEVSAGEAEAIEVSVELPEIEEVQEEEIALPETEEVELELPAEESVEEALAEEQDDDVTAEIALPVAEADEISEIPEEAVTGEAPEAQENLFLVLAEQFAQADEDTIEIFLEEANELAMELDDSTAQWMAEHGQVENAAALKRILHTIKGGARMAELGVLGDVTHDFETMIEHAEAHQQFDDAFFEKVQSYQDQVQALVDFVLAGANPDAAPQMPVMAVVQEEQAIEEVAAEPEVETVELVESEAEELTTEEPEEVEVTEAVAAPVPEVEEDSGVEVAEVAEEQNVFLTLAEQYAQADEETVEIFLEEANELAMELDDSTAEWLANRDQHEHADALKRILHTIKGGARMAELGALGDVTHDFETMIEHAEAHRQFDDAFFANIQTYQDQVQAMVDFVLAGANPDNAPDIKVAAPSISTEAPEAEMPEVSEPAQEQVDEDIEQPVSEEAAEQVDPTGVDTLFAKLSDEFAKADEDTMEIFMEEANELAEALDEAGSQWLANREQAEHADELKRILHTIKGGARMAELGTLGDITHDYETMIEHAQAHKAYDDAFFENVQSYQDNIQKLFEFLASGAQLGDTAKVTEPVDELIITQPATPVVEDTNVELPPTATETVEATQLDDDVDAELLELFVEEAKEQVENIEESIANFLADNSNKEPLEELKRLLHTVKGGARMAGVSIIGDVSHDFETYIITAERESTTQDDAFIDELQAFHEKLSQLLAGIAPQGDQAATQAAPEAGEQKADNVVPIRPDIKADESLVTQAAIDATRVFIENFNKEQQQRGTREPVKVAPDLLESLINLAGESSIGRSRIEEQINELTFSLEEMDMTVDRLHSQLRRLEIETEAQISFRTEQLGEEAEDFDPLEMDMYTNMQQLSKSLIEAASDLDDISATFTNKMRDMETLLLQQSRINTELQEGLMRAQMVPFSRMVPRLRRIIRQVAQELGKKVEFSVENAEGELDRTILERMVAPLEHMLRNAVDHGIEMPDVRKAAGKSETGKIVLSLSREGGEVVLTLQDNGAGVNLKAVKKKAIERGLMTADAPLSDHEISQFILHAGFSTAEKITQISGRGVGMDVVHSEIKQMGGSVEINSETGQGTQFVVRLPFTVSVNRALMVVSGNDTFAIPLNTIEGIVRVSPYELEAYYQPDAPLFEYAGQHYNLRYMGSLTHRGSQAHLEDTSMPLPVILIRSADYSVAVQVDRLLGSQEVVVKSLGPQFGMVEGLSGATVLGDGSVVVILDMLALIRADASRGIINEAAAMALEAEEAIEEKRATKVMVTDDSVTVRKVTSRLLERFGLEVVLAKDGLDAITQLQEMEVLPDIMLLDIEMPRMDGFEVVSRVRHNSRLQDIPIVMITSRTGEKHRERALSLGATRYLGKPFQENELLQTISELTNADILEA